MINLLPPDVKESYRYARRNARLARWVSNVSFALIGLVALSVAGILYLHQTAGSYDGQVASLETSLQQQNQVATTKQVTEISGNLKLAVQVLGKEVLYSQLLKQLATIIPANTSLAGLNISQVSGALDITANAADYNTATQLQVNLADPNNRIFSKADIVSISCGGTNSASSGTVEIKRYPCSVTVRALFATNNPFLFIGDSTKKTGAQQ